MVGQARRCGGGDRAAVRERAVNLAVMGAYGCSRIRHHIVGSKATAMVRACQVPVLMFR